MSKTPEEMAEEYLNKNYELNPHFPADVQGDKLPDRQAARPAFLAGYKAAQAIVEEELQAVQAQRVEYPGLGAAQYALKNVLAKMESK